jgi:tagatose-1,6-bisphosphate aldolase non-catalytic subunit AgaZ/GatZ
MNTDALLRKIASKKNMPVIDLLLAILDRLTNTMMNGKKGITLLGICPITINVVKASIRTASFMDFPLMFVATLNQIDIDGGYTGLTQKDFVKLVRKEVERCEYNGPVIIALDHGGPWLKDKHVIEGYSFEETVDWTMKSIEACIKAGYDLLHIDTTVDVTLKKGERLSIKDVVERTVMLIEYAEDVRKKEGVQKLGYEVGTEEVHGGITSPELFEKFIIELRAKLKERKLEEIWPCFIVGDIGTYPILENKLNVEKSRILVNIARAYNLHVKGHYTDFVLNPEDYPNIGIAAANIGPELAYSEYLTLNSLANMEEKLLNSEKISKLSNIIEELDKLIIESGRWRKWLREKEADWKDIPHDIRQWLLGTGARYVLSDQRIINKINELSNNLEKYGINVNEKLDKSIRDVLMKYVNAFNLKDTCFKIASALLDLL